MVLVSEDVPDFPQAHNEEACKCFNLDGCIEEGTILACIKQLKKERTAFRKEHGYDRSLRAFWKSKKGEAAYCAAFDDGLTASIKKLNDRLKILRGD